MWLYLSKTRPGTPDGLQVEACSNGKEEPKRSFRSNNTVGYRVQKSFVGGCEDKASKYIGTDLLPSFALMSFRRMKEEPCLQSSILSSLISYYYSSSRSMAIRGASTIRLSPTHQMTGGKGKLIYIRDNVGKQRRLQATIVVIALRSPCQDLRLSIGYNRSTTAPAYENLERARYVFSRTNELGKCTQFCHVSPKLKMSFTISLV